MQEKYRIVVAEDFSDTPGARDTGDGDFSGEAFLKKHLLPKFEKAVSEEGLLTIILDGAWGYPSSFISASFGKLSVMKGKDLLLKYINFVSDNKVKIEKIVGEINHPFKKV